MERRAPSKSVSNFWKGGRGGSGVSAPDEAALRVLLALRHARVQLFADLTAHAAQAAEAAAADLRANREPKQAQKRLDAFERTDKRKLISEHVAQIAEFYFVLQAAGLGPPAHPDQTLIRGWLERHNADIGASVTEAEAKGYSAKGLDAGRLKRGLISENQILWVLDQSFNGQLRLSQSVLQSLLVEVMSPATTAATLKLMGDYGFLVRAPSSTVSYRSEGVLEGIFRAYLRELSTSDGREG